MDYNKFRNNDNKKKANELYNHILVNFIKNNEINKTLFKKYNLLGKGTTGEIYELSNNIVIKYFYKNNEKKYITKYEIIHIPMELFINQEASELIDNCICPNFLYCYKINESPPFLLLEKADGTVKDFLKFVVKHANDTNYKHYYNILKSMIFQLSIALLCMNKYMDIYHYDLQSNNLFYKKINENVMFQYKLNDITYYVPTYGYLFMIGDFGNAISNIQLSKVKYILETTHGKSVNLTKKIHKVQQDKFKTLSEDYHFMTMLHNRLLKEFISKTISHETINELKNKFVPSRISFENFNNAIKMINPKSKNETENYSVVIHYLINNHAIDLKDIVPEYILVLYHKINKYVSLFDNIKKFDTVDDYLNMFSTFKKYKNDNNNNNINKVVFNVIKNKLHINTNLHYRKHINERYNFTTYEKCLKKINKIINTDTYDKFMNVVNFPKKYLLESHKCGYASLISYIKPSDMNTDSWSSFVDNSFFIEKKTNLLIDNNICPNFVYTLHYDKKNLYVIKEYIDMSLYNFIFTLITKYEDGNDKLYTFLLSITFQILISLLCIEQKIKIKNITFGQSHTLLRRIHKVTFNYNVNGIDYYIPTFGYLIMLSNFINDATVFNTDNQTNEEIFNNNKYYYEKLKGFLYTIYVKILYKNNIRSINNLLESKIISHDDHGILLTFAEKNLNKIKDYMKKMHKDIIHLDYHLFEFTMRFAIKNKMIYFNKITSQHFIDQLNDYKIFIKKLLLNENSIEKNIFMSFDKFKINNNDKDVYKFMM